MRAFSPAHNWQFSAARTQAPNGRSLRSHSRQPQPFRQQGCGQGAAALDEVAAAVGGYGAGATPVAGGTGAAGSGATGCGCATRSPGAGGSGIGGKPPGSSLAAVVRWTSGCANGGVAEGVPSAAIARMAVTASSAMAAKMIRVYRIGLLRCWHAGYLFSTRRVV